MPHASLHTRPVDAAPDRSGVWGRIIGAVTRAMPLVLATAVPVPIAAAEGEKDVFRVETDVYDADDGQPVAHSLTLFRRGVAWDFLETLPKKGEQAAVEPAEFVLHDPVRERVILVDPARNVKTKIDAMQLERLRSSLASWARKSEDPLMRWAAGPDFSTALSEEGGKTVLAGPRVRYEVRHDRAPADGLAEEYRRFADAAVLVKALVHPGGLPPFPRLAINRQLAAVGAIPAAVRLEIEPRLGRLGGRPTVMRSEHRALPSWVASDFKRVAAAEERLSLAEEVDLASYAGTPRAAGKGAESVSR